METKRKQNCPVCGAFLKTPKNGGFVERCHKCGSVFSPPVQSTEKEREAQAPDLATVK